MLFMLSYDLLSPKQDYETLNRAVRNAGGVRVLESEWLLPSESRAVELHQTFARHIDADDRLAVTEVTRESAWSRGRLLIDDEDLKRLFVHARA